MVTKRGLVVINTRLEGSSPRGKRQSFPNYFIGKWKTLSGNLRDTCLPLRHPVKED